MNRTIAFALAPALLVGAAFVGGCGHDARPPVTPALTAATPLRAPAPAAQARKSDRDVNLSTAIRTACNIDDADRAPKFDFDSSKLAQNDRDVLTKVAQCVTTGPLKGRALSLVGRADPRGEQEYNMTLGESRATSVQKYLAQLGVDMGKMSETSRGALDATGYDDATWRKDRRVDVDLVK